MKINPSERKQRSIHMLKYVYSQRCFSTYASDYHVALALTDDICAKIIPAKILADVRLRRGRRCMRGGSSSLTRSKQACCRWRSTWSELDVSPANRPENCSLTGVLPTGSAEPSRSNRRTRRWKIIVYTCCQIDDPSISYSTSTKLRDISYLRIRSVTLWDLDLIARTFMMTVISTRYSFVTHSIGCR